MHKLFYILIALCFLSSILPREVSINQAPENFPGWPEAFQGKALKALPLTKREKIFEKNFPGHVGRFTDGQREIIFRWVARPTRKLHPSHHCFRATGFDIKFLPLHRDASNDMWGQFRAQKDNEQFLVQERIFESNNKTQSWTDVSTWFWKALLNKSSGPWWAITITSKKNNFER